MADAQGPTLPDSSGEFVWKHWYLRARVLSVDSLISSCRIRIATSGINFGKIAEGRLVVCSCNRRRRKCGSDVIQ